MRDHEACVDCSPVPGILGMSCPSLVKSLWEYWVPHLCVTSAWVWVLRVLGSGFCLSWLWLWLLLGKVWVAGISVGGGSPFGYRIVHHSPGLPCEKFPVPGAADRDERVPFCFGAELAASCLSERGLDSMVFVSLDLAGTGQ